jgi:26S proteasome regulatory subunit N7
MADSFGVSVSFIDRYYFFSIILLRELSDLIASRRLTCKIDKVSGIVESQKNDERNNLYQNVLK